MEEVIAPADVEMRSPPVFGEGPAGRTIGGRCRRVFSCVLQDVVVSSKSSLLLTDTQAVMDFQDGELESVPIQIDVDPIVLGADGDQLAVLVDRDPEVVGEAFPLVGVHTYNFGHWVVEHLFRLWASMHQPGFDGVTLLIDEKMPAQLREALEFFAPNNPVRVVGQGTSVEVRRLWTCSSPVYWPVGDTRAETGPEAELGDAAALARVLARLERRLESLGGDSPAGARLYLTRRGGRMANRSEVESWFTEHGFDVLDYGELPFADQLRCTRGADVVILEGGSTMFGLLFALTGTRVGFLAAPPPNGYEWINGVLAARGIRTLLLTGERTAEHPLYADNAEFVVDTGALPGFIEALGG
jgi:capsular polysaccharide biosynthesis protein